MKKIKSKNIKLFLYGSLLLVVLIYIGYLLAYNNYSNKNKVENNKTISKGMAIYLQGEDGNYKFSKEIPTKEGGLVLDEEKSMCDGNTKVSWNYTDWRLVLKDIDSENLKCYLYFRKTNVKEQILANKTISERTDFSTPLTTDTTGTIYKALDDDGETYYFAGANDENWVKFAGFYWRIIRVNGDGTVRLIYSGTGDTITNANRTGVGTQIGTSAFNTTANDNMHVGYMYEENKVQGLENSSKIKGVLELWYKTNIIDKDYDKHVDVNAGFCGDRTAYTNSNGTTTGGGTGITETYYGAYIRLKINKTPTLKCNKGNNNPDLYTKTGANKGNKALTQPVGLITADEVAYAGGVNGANNDKFYLYTNRVYWTMSPACFISTSRYAYMFHVDTTGNFNRDIVSFENSVRPTLNLRADTIFKPGTIGTIDNPYVVE